MQVVAKSISVFPGAGIFIVLAGAGVVPVSGSSARKLMAFGVMPEIIFLDFHDGEFYLPGHTAYGVDGHRLIPGPETWVFRPVI
jgi:hypothetical protein